MTTITLKKCLSGQSAFSVPFKVTDLPSSARIRKQTQMATEYLVFLDGRWRRVYAYCPTNQCSYYIGTPQNWEYWVEISHK